MGRRQPASRIEKVLEAGEAHAQKTLLGRLPAELTELILRKVKSPLQTCAIVRRMCETGDLPCQTRIDHLNLIRIVFFEATSEADDKYVDISKVLLIVNAIFHFPNDFNVVLEHLCESYARATKAIVNMERPLPWRDTGFDWGTPSFEPVSYASMPRYIDIFRALNTAAKLTHEYLILDRMEVITKQHLLRGQERRIKEYLLYGARQDFFPLVDYADIAYEQKYKEWSASQRDILPLLEAGFLPEQCRDPAWLPAHDPRRELFCLRARIDRKGRITEHFFEYKDPGRGRFSMFRVNVQIEG